MALLEVDNLRVEFPTRRGTLVAVDDVSFAIDEGEADTIATRRDKSLTAIGIRVMRIKAADILDNMDDVLARITAGMRMRIADKQAARREHHASHPRQNAPRTSRKPHAQNR